MKFALKPIALALLVAMSVLGGAANAQTTKLPTVSASETAKAADKTPIQTKAPDDWIIYDDITYMPVLDDVSRHLAAARKAFDTNDNKTAAMEMHAVADQLKRQAATADKNAQAQVSADNTPLAKDKKSQREAVKSMNASAQKADLAAADIESGKIKTKAELDKVINKAARADMDRRWEVIDVTTLYQVNEEPQHHFMDAATAYAKKDYKASAAEIRKAISFLRLESKRAAGAAKKALDASVTQLEQLASATEKGAVKDVQTMKKAFATVNHALALERRSKAADSLVRKEYDRAGYELKAAAHSLESAADWIGEEAKTGAAATVAGTRALGDKLASGAAWTRDEVSDGIKALGNNINLLSKKIHTTKKASPK